MVAHPRTLGVVIVMIVAVASCSSAGPPPTPFEATPAGAAPSVAPASSAPPVATPSSRPAAGTSTPASSPVAAASATSAGCAGPCTVQLWERSYSPSVIHVKAGGAVTWINHSCPGCTITFTSLGVDSGATAVGDTFTQTFNTPGQYVFHCELDPEEMVGIVAVTP
jgi:plastocyanin